VSIPQLSGPALDYVCELRGVCQVFVDTEAFSEVDREGRVVAPITDDAWIGRTRVMYRIAAALGDGAVLVAPDRVGDQQETLRRLALFSDVMRACAALGARIVVPIQRGGMSAALFFDACACLLGCSFVAGIPGNKAAMPPGELEDFLRARRPRAVHLLGVGPKSPRFRPLLDVLRRFVPGAVVSCDSNALAAAVGKTNGAGGGPRHLTAWQDFIEGRPSPVATCGTTVDGCRRPTAEELEKARETAIVRAFGPELFLARAMAAYQEAGLVATREAPLQPGLFDEIRGKGVTRAA
jgi:hypothetical protein